MITIRTSALSIIDNVISALEGRGHSISESSSGWINTSCPCHWAHPNGDKHASFGFKEFFNDEGESYIVLKCFGGCSRSSILSALSIHERELHSNPDGRHAERMIRPAKADLTIEAYAIEKKLPLEFLMMECGMHDAVMTFHKKDGSPYLRRGVAMPYIQENGHMFSRAKLRISFDKKPAWLWQEGDADPIVYGLQFLPKMQEMGYGIICEGESDVQTLAYHGIPALGVPGAPLASKLPMIMGVPRLFIIQEEDGQAGKDFPYNVMMHLRKKGFTGEIVRVPLLSITGCKDPSALHCKMGKGFGEAWAKALAGAMGMDYDTGEEEEFDFSIAKAQGEPDIIGIRKQIALFLAEFDPFQIDNKLFQQYLSRILYQLPCTDNGNAIRLSARYGHLFRYIHEQKGFYVWNGKYWEEDRTSQVMAFARITSQYLSCEADQIPVPNATDEAALEAYEKHQKAFMRWAIASQSKGRITNMMELTSSEHKKHGGFVNASISLEEFDANDWLFNCQNGTLDLEKASSGVVTFLPHNPSHLITKISGGLYEPNMECPAWIANMQTIMDGNQDLINFHQDLVGCGLIGRQLDDILAIAFGPGGNGKGIFAEVLKGCLGDYADTAVSDLFLEKKSEGIPNDKAALRGVRFLTISESDEGRKLNESVVKGMTSSDTQKVRFLNKEFFSMKPKFTPILFTNHKPVIKGTDNGIWRRVKFIPWMHNFEIDPDAQPRHIMHERLEQEYSGILNWAIEGLKRRMQGKLITVPDIIAYETSSYRGQCDSLKDFLDDYCVIDEPEAREDRKILYAKYCRYAEDEAGQTKGMISTMKGFLSKLRERTDIPFFGEIFSHNVRYISGIRLLSDGESPHPSSPLTDRNKEEGSPF